MIEEIYIGGKRFYRVPDDNIYPSVTTVLSILSEKGIDIWKQKVGESVAKYIQVESTTHGTEYHRLVEAYLKKEYPLESADLIAYAHFRNILPLLQPIQNIKAQEIPLYSHSLEMAGRTDCIAEYDGEPSILDFKTSTKFKERKYINAYFMQATAYSVMYEELTGEKIRQLVILISSADNRATRYISHREQWIDKLIQVRNQYRKIHIDDAVN